MKLAGVAACVPKRIVEHEFAYEKFEKFDVDRIVGNTGVQRKREADFETTAMDLCLPAAKALLERLDWAPDTVDAVIFVTMLADHITPSTAYRAQHELGIGTGALVFDINLGCSGYTHGMVVLQGLIKAGLVKRALLLCGEAVQGRLKPMSHEAEHRSDLANSLLCGEAGTATALSAEGESQVVATAHGADGAGYENIIVRGGGGRSWFTPACLERSEDPTGEVRRPVDLVIEGPKILAFTMKRVPPLVKSLLADSGWEKDDIDQWVLHQANKFMIDFLVRRTKLPAEKVPMSIPDFGNTSSASIPLTIVTQCSDWFDKPTKWAMLGFGVGLSWSGVFLETDHIAVPPLVEI